MRDRIGLEDVASVSVPSVAQRLFAMFERQNKPFSPDAEFMAAFEARPDRFPPMPTGRAKRGAVKADDESVDKPWFDGRICDALAELMGWLHGHELAARYPDIVGEDCRDGKWDDGTAMDPDAVRAVLARAEQIELAAVYGKCVELEPCGAGYKVWLRFFDDPDFEEIYRVGVFALCGTGPMFEVWKAAVEAGRVSPFADCEALADAA